MNPAIPSNEASVVITFLSSFLIWVMLSGLVFLWIIDGRVKREQALHAILASLIAWGFSFMIKTLLPSERPFVERGINPLTLTLPSENSSFPSTHASVAFALAVSIWIHNKKLGSRFLLMAVFVALGRILSNVHFLADILVGALIGVITAFITRRLHTFRLLK